MRDINETYRKNKQTGNPGRDQKKKISKILVFKHWQQLFKGIHRMGFNKYFWFI